MIEERFESASQALAVLKGEEKINNWQNDSLRKPAHSKITLTKTRNKININIPHNKGEPGDFNYLWLSSFYLMLLVSICFFPSNSPHNVFPLFVCYMLIMKSQDLLLLKGL